jgi:hypothetical protein
MAHECAGVGTSGAAESLEQVFQQAVALRRADDLRRAHRAAQLGLSDRERDFPVYRPRSTNTSKGLPLRSTDTVA